MSPTRVRSLPSPRSAHGPWMEQVKPDDAISDPLPSVTLGTQVAQKMVARGRQTMPVGPEVGLADELDGLRFQQFGSVHEDHARGFGPSEVDSNRSALSRGHEKALQTTGAFPKKAPATADVGLWADP